MLEPNHAQDRIDEALSVLRELGLPREQQNERSALTLLAVLDLSPTDLWEAATAPLIGVTPIMEWVETNFGRTYAPNTREMFRRFTLHQFVDAGLVVPNPDQPDRPVNSPKYCYQIEPEAHALLKTFGTGQWETVLARYLERRPELRVKHAQFREMRKIPLVLVSAKPGLVFVTAFPDRRTFLRYFGEVQPTPTFGTMKTHAPRGDRFRLAIASGERATDTGSARSALKSAGEGRDPRWRPIANRAAHWSGPR